MKRGLVLGKFMPLHNGHIEMINFAKTKCDKVVILLCAEASEPIDAMTRVKFINDVFGQDDNIEINYMSYSAFQLSPSSDYEETETKKWADRIASYNFNLDVIISSEEYGKHLARFMEIDYIDYDIDRQKIPISATEIRKNPYKNWDKIPDTVREYYYKKMFKE